MMKKIVLFFASMLLVSSVWAIRAYRMPVAVVQSDGTRLVVIGHGDESFNYYTTTDGVLLYHEGNDFFVAGIDAAGGIVGTNVLAHEPALRNADEARLVSIQDRERFYSSIGRNVQRSPMMKEHVAANSTYFPHIGTPKALVVLAEFSDVKFTVKSPKEAFEQYLNAEGALSDLGNGDAANNGSVAKYFADMSFGAFRPQFDVYGPVTLGNPLSYYGAGSDNMLRFIPDVCAAVDAEVDFREYDQNGDGNVDLVYVIYAGYAQSYPGNSTDCIWPKSGTVSGGSFDGVRVFRFGVNNELFGAQSDGGGSIEGVGLFCHEFSHCLGMPDMYVTSGNSETVKADNQEMEWWSVMDYGAYLRNGYRPAAYTAWEREFMEWIEIEDLAVAQSVELKSVDEGGKAYRVRNDNDASGNEYYILENVQKKGWNRSQLGHGMLAIHVDYNDGAFSLNGNSVNNTLGHPRMTVLAADGVLRNINNVSATDNLGTIYGGDPFPGVANVTKLADDTEVKPVVYSGTGLQKPIYNIKEADGIVTFDFLEDISSGIGAIKEAAPAADGRIYTIDGRYVGNDKGSLGKGVFIMDRKKVVVK